MQVPENDTFQKIEITIACRSLKDADVFSKSDPQVVFKVKNSSTGQWYEIGKTETIKNNLNPNFKKIFEVNYVFEEKQEVYFEVRDDDGKGSYDHLGECFTTIGAIVGSRNNTLILDLIDKKTQKKINKSKIILIADKINECNAYVYAQWKGVKLMNTDGWFDKSDPFLRIKRVRNDNTLVLVHETEQIMNNLNPIWKPFELPCSRLNNGNNLQPIKMECWDWQKNSKHQFIGEFQFTVDELVKGKREFELTNPKKKHPGKIVAENFQYIEKPTFLQYIRGNTQLNLVLAVDFTASNGAVSTPQSLHYCNPQVMNAYQQAMQSVGEILLDYDFDKKVPCYGFGGVPRYPGLTFPNTQHCFPMSGNPNNSEAFGLGEIMNLYHHSLQYVSLSGPTLFNPILQETIKIAQTCQQQGSQVYTIMLILTDGEIHDMNETIDSLVFASGLPLSVIIVGIGNADFTNMERLDGDQGGLVNSRGQKATRDVVQFVPFRTFKGNGPSLCKEVLAEVPTQLVQYMTSQGIRPQPAPQINPQAIQIQQTIVQEQQMYPTQNKQEFQQPHYAPPPPQVQQASINQNYQQTQNKQEFQQPHYAPPPPQVQYASINQNYQQQNNFNQPPQQNLLNPNMNQTQQLPHVQIGVTQSVYQPQVNLLQPNMNQTQQLPNVQIGVTQSVYYNSNQNPPQQMQGSMQNPPKQY